MDSALQIIVNGLIAGSLYACIALGFNLIFSVTKFFNLAHGGMVLIGAYTTLALRNSYGVSLIPALFAGVAVAALAGMILEKILFSKLRKRHASHMVFLVASLGAYTAIQAGIALIFSSQFFSIPLSFEPPLIHMGPVSITGLQLLIMIITVCVFLLLVFFMRKTTLGKSFVACADDSEVARIVGIDTDRILLIAFAAGSALAGLGGILTGLDTGIEPTAGLSILLKAIIAAVIGGTGSISGAFVGSYVLGLVENIGIWGLAAAWKDAIAFLLLILFLIFRPQGLFKR
ncbi:branched-chain amino acid ABC transporter permease [Candidatus Uhrbacteria bacterium]|nr:branched-chain amino acid ABC transporter permease [Candidatus Uhrbacteria bacterium]